ncbi:MAG TPA: porin [Xanthobacteraceae bacterium]|nr:porin [Xanthobacteraceae bacterium]
MWTSTKAIRSIIAAATALLAGFAVTPSHAQPVEYVRVCSLYGAGFFYIPGTDTCVQTRQIVDNQFAIARLNTRAATGTAMAASLVAPWLPSGTNYAVSNHWAGFDGQHAFGFSGLMRINGNFVFSGGFAAGLDRGKLSTFNERTQTQYGTSTPQESWSEIRMLSRAGFMYAW